MTSLVTICRRVLAATSLVLGIALPSTLQAQTLSPTNNGWTRIATGYYPGGTVRVELPFAADVETTQVAVSVPSYCAPRALASRARIIDDLDFGQWPRTVDLRFNNQQVVGGNINAFYTVDANSGRLPLVTGVTFSFAPARSFQSQGCPITVYALPGR